MRAGVLDRLGLGYDTLRTDNPRLVFCSLSGLGLDGPYPTLGSPGPSFDAFAALSSLNPYALDPSQPEGRHPTRIPALSLYSHLGVLSSRVPRPPTRSGAHLRGTRPAH